MGRLEREKAFHNEIFDGDERRVVDKYYSITKNSHKKYYDSLLNDCKGKKILEYGCGPGSAAFELAQHGAEVIGIDISDVAIQQAYQQAEEMGLNITFKTMNAEELKFDDNSFDMVCGSGIIHHLDVDKAYKEILRVLKPESSAYFSEPLGHNPFINLYRFLTPKLRTEDEHPLLMPDIHLAKTHFSNVEVSYFHLTSFLAIPFRKSFLFNPFVNFFDTIDKILFKIPFFSKMSWVIVLRLIK